MKFRYSKTPYFKEIIDALNSPSEDIIIHIPGSIGKSMGVIDKMILSVTHFPRKKKKRFKKEHGL